MPVMDGLEAARMLRFAHKYSKHILIIILTADATLDTLSACENAGIDAFLTKPIESVKLLRTITALLSDKQKKEEKHDQIIITEAPSPSFSTQDMKVSILDVKHLDHLVSLSKDIGFMHDLINGFLNDTGSLINKIEQALGQHDNSTVQGCLHTLKGSAQSIGASALGHYASLMHDNTQNNISQDILVLTSELKCKFDLTQSALLEYRNKLEPVVI